MKKIQKLFPISLKSVDEEKRTVKFVFSDNSVDRMGEIVDQASWDVKNYQNNPVILWGHNPENPENVLGRGVDLELDSNGKSFITAQFDDAETNPKADMVFRQVLKGTLRTVSAGFIPHTFEMQDDTPVLKDNELLEVSIVAIPANANAVALSLKSGEISKKDAQWLLKGMREGAEAVEEQLKAMEGEDVSEKDLKSVEEKIGTLTEAVGKLADGFAELQQKVDNIATKAEETTPEEHEEPKGDTEEQPTGDEPKDDDSANGGDNDQPGAEEEDIDLDAELSPEQEEALAEELAAAGDVQDEAA